MQRCVRLVGTFGLGLGIACGGGGSGESSTPDAVITEADAPLITAEVMRALSFSTDIGGVGSASEDSDALSAADATVLRGTSAVTAAIVVPPTTLACGESGTQTISGDVANPSTPTPGDRFDTSFDDCQEEEDGPILDGDFDFIVLAFAGDFDAGIFSWRLDVDLTDLLFTQDSETLELDGSVQLTQDTLEPDLDSSILTGGTLTATDEMDHSITLQNFFVSLDQEVEPDDGEEAPDYVLDAVGILTSSFFTGRVRFDVLEVFEGEVPDPPAAGEMRITGADGATIDVEGDGENVILVVDLDGPDGPIEPLPADTMTWEELFEVEPVTTLLQSPSFGASLTSTFVVMPVAPPLSGGGASGSLVFGD